MSMSVLLKGCAFLLGAGLLISTGACDGGGDDGGGGTDGGGSGASGGSGATGGASGSTFSCDTPAKFACIEMDIPAGPGRDAAADQCTSDGGTPGTACPTASVIAECKSSIHYFYYSGFNGLSQAQSVCGSLGGTWSTP